MFVSHLAVSQHDTGQTMWGVHPPSSSRRMLPQFDDFGKQRSVYARGVAGGGEGGQTCKKNFTFLKSESFSTHLKFCWDAVEGREKARGGTVYTVLGRLSWKTTSIWSATQIYLLLIFSPAFLKLIIDCYELDCSS